MIYTKNSPYFSTPKANFYLGVYVDRPISPDVSDDIIEITAKYTNRPDLLAHDLYGNSRYWWVFMRRNLNRIRDPIYDMVPGLEIYVPTKNRLLELLG